MGISTEQMILAATSNLGNPSFDELKRTFRPPPYYSPFPVRVNPHSLNGQFSVKAHQWLLDFKVDTAFTPKMYKIIIDSDPSVLPTQIYTEAEEEELDWACRFFMMFWVLDDTLDSTHVGKSPEACFSFMLDIHVGMLWSFPDDVRLLNGCEPFLKHLEDEAREEKRRYIASVLAEARTKPGTAYPKETSPVVRAYLDVYFSAVKRASPAVCLRLAYNVQDWLTGCHKETEIRKVEALPSSVKHYMNIREDSAGVPVTVAMVDVVYNLETPDSYYYLPEMQRMMSAVNDIVSWHNDLWSFKREVLVQKDTFNIVLAISIERKVSYKEAAQIATNMVYERIAALEQAAFELEAVTPPELRRSYEMYVLTCRNWVPATQYWHSTVIRYKQ